MITAFGAVLQALTYLGVRQVALGTPYAEDTSLKGKAHLEAHGLQVVGFGRLGNVRNIYDETPERAYGLARRVDRPENADALRNNLGTDAIARDNRDPKRHRLQNIDTANAERFGLR